MRLVALAILVLAIFVAVWMFVVVPAEKKHHQRKLDSVRRRIEKREAEAERKNYTATDDNEAGDTAEPRGHD